MKQRILIGVLLALWSALAPAAVIKTIQAGSVDQTVVIKIIDATDGTPETGVAFNTSGIDLEYWRHGANSVVDITEVTQTVSGAHTDGGFVALGNGLYRLDLPDAAVATGATAVEIMGTVTGMIVIGGTVDLSPPANVVSFGGTAGTFASGRPEVNTSHIAGSAVSTSSAQIGVNVVNAGGTAWGSGAITAASIATDAIGAAELASDAGTELGTATWATTTRQLTSAQTFNLTGSITGNLSGSVGSIGTGGITEASFATTAGSFDALGIIDQGTAQAATSTTLQLRSAAAFADDEIIGSTCLITGGSAGVGQARTITDYAASTDTATVATWTTTPTGTITYECFGTAASSAGSGATAAEVWAYSDRQLTAFDEDATTIDINATPTGAAASVTGAVGSVTGNVGGNVTGSVGSVATGGITAASIATDAIGAAEIAADAGTELGTATWASTTRLLTAGTNIVLAKGTGVTGFNDPTTAAIADAVWDEPQSGHVSAGTFGAYLDSSVSGVSTGGVSAADIADAVWDEALSGHATSGSAGAGLTAASGTLSASAVRSAIGLATANLDTQLSTIDTNVDSILVDTAEIGVAGAGLTAVDDAVLSAIAALNNLSATDVGNLTIEDQGGGVSLRCALAVLLSYAAGDLATSSNTPTYEDPSGTETRITGTISSAGNRSMTITCPTY